MDFGLKNRRVVIVGAQRGIGFEVAKAFKAQGANVVITAEDAAVYEARDQLNKEQTGPAVEALQFDITDRQAVIDAYASIGHIDVVIANAGIYKETPSTDLSEANAALFAKHLEIDVVGANNCAVAAVPHMKEGGRIIFTASTWGIQGAYNYSAYVASKHGVIGLVKAMAMDLGRLGISVNAVNPGSVGTQTNINGLPEERKKELAAQMVIRPGLIDPKHIAGAYLFLASDAASEITGQSITIDRGQTI